VELWNSDRTMDWSTIDHRAGMSVFSRETDFDAAAMGLQKAGGLRLGPRLHPFDDVGFEVDGWLWVEKAGVLRLKPAELRGSYKFFFDGRLMAKGGATFSDVQRGFHRIRHIHFAHNGSPPSFKLLMAEGGSAELVPVEASRLYHGPEIMDLPLIQVVATAHSYYDHKLAIPSTIEPDCSIIDGALPGGLTLTRSGTIQGHPTEEGTHYFTVRVSTGKIEAQRQLALHVLPSVPTENLNTEESFVLTFDGGTANAPGIRFAESPDADGKIGLGMGSLALKRFHRQSGPVWMIDQSGGGALGSSGSLKAQQTEMGIYLLAAQKERLSDFLPALRHANRFSVYFRMPQHALRGEVLLDWSKDPMKYLHKVLQNAHMAGHNATRTTDAQKEQRNWHFYHKVSSYWPDVWKTGQFMYVGNGWFYYETSEQVQSQRTGPGKLTGFYNPIRDFDRNYMETLSRIYFAIDYHFGASGNVYNKGIMRYDNIRFFRREANVAARTHQGEQAYRVAVGPTARMVNMPFRLTYSGTRTVRFQIARHAGKVPAFDGKGVYADRNGNGKIDEGDVELSDAHYTQEFVPGQTRYYIARVNVGAQKLDTTTTHGVHFRIVDRADVYSLDGDSMMFLVYKTTNPAEVQLSNIHVDSIAKRRPSPIQGANQLPQVQITAAPTTARVGETVECAGTVSDADGPLDPRPYWDFGDATPYAFGSKSSHVYKHPGTYRIRLYGSDSVARSIAERTITVTE